MKKWLEEKILIKYWIENCSKYTLSNGNKIKSAQHSIPFDTYPDIQSNELDDGRIVPAEIEWTTSNFEKHGHDISKLVNNNGFLIVLEKDLQSFPVEQIQIDQKDFMEWFKNDAKNIANETIQSIKKNVIKNKEPQVFISYSRSTRTGKINKPRTFQHGTDGFPETIRSKALQMLSQVKKGDIFVVAYDYKSSIKVSGGRNPPEKHKGTFKEIYGVVVTKGYYYSKSPKIWIEDKVDYPHRYDFRKKKLFEGSDVPCTIKDLGRNLHGILRKLQIGGSIEKIDSSMILKLMSLCRK